MPAHTLRRVVLDTDTYNEVDDQFALAHLLLSPEEVCLEAIYAAPFYIKGRCSDPGDGMEKSYEEIWRVLELVKSVRRPPAFRGSPRFLPGLLVPVESPAAADLVERAMQGADSPLYVVSIGAPTNVASALLMQPEIAERIVVVWLGGHAPYWHDTREFNLRQDLHASRILLDMEVPLVMIPCFPVASHLITTVDELEGSLAGRSQLGRYLTDIVRGYRKPNDQGTWSKVIWDIAASAWAIRPAWVRTFQQPSPLLRDDFTWQLDPARRPIEIACELNRDAIFGDFFTKAQNA